MPRFINITIGLLWLLIFSALSEGQPRKLIVPTMPGMHSTKNMPLLEALEKSNLCESAKMGPDLAASMEEEKEYKAYKTAKSVSEVMEYYVDFAQKNGMPDASPSVWDNTKGKEAENQPKEASGTITFSFDLQNERISGTVVAYRGEKEGATTVYIFLPQREKKK